MPRHHKRKNRREARAAKEHGGVSAPSLPELDEEQVQPPAVPPQLEAAAAGVAALAGPWDAMERTLAALDDDEEQSEAAPTQEGDTSR